MHNNWNNGLKMVAFIIAFMFLMLAVRAEKVESVDDTKETPNAKLQTVPLQSEQHTMAKRAWNQLQSGWGKRNFEDDPKESLDELQRKIMKLYNEQLLSNQADDEEYAPEDYDGQAEKRAWKQMGTAWGKRDWSQLRGNGWGKRDAGNWNNMRGLWGKRSPGWNKLSSAWGK